MKPLSFSEKAGNTIPKQIWNTEILNASIILVLSELTNKCKNVPLFLLIGLIGVDGLPGLILLKATLHSRSSWNKHTVSTVSRRRPDKRPKLTRWVPFDTKECPLKVPHCTCEAISHFSRWYPQPGPFESLPPEHVIADKGPGVNQELRLPARPFATVAVVKQDGSLNTPSIFYSILTSLKSQQGPHALELLARCHHLPLPLKGWAAFKPFGLFLPDAGHWPFCLSSCAI